MSFKGLQSKINVFETARQRVPGCRTGTGKRPSRVRGQIDTGSPVHHDQPSVGDGGQKRWTRIFYVKRRYSSLLLLLYYYNSAPWSTIVEELTQ